MSDAATPPSSAPPRDEALEDFLDKWRARWPEWRIAQVFVPEAQRTLVEAWFTLLQELTDAAWAGRETAPGFAKLAWWQDELRGWCKGARRHPLGRVLQKQAAAWDVLAASLPALQASREAMHAGTDETQYIERLRPCGLAIAKIEAVLFADAGVPDTDPSTMADARARSLLLAHALGRVGETRIDDRQIDDTQIDGAQTNSMQTRDAGAGVNAGSPTRSPVSATPAIAALAIAAPGPRPRRIVDAWCRARSRTMRPLPVWRALFVAWRAAVG